MAADALAHPPLFTTDEAVRIRGALLRLSLPSESETELEDSFVAWDTSCWRCGELSRVWMENPTFFGPLISEDCARSTVRDAATRGGAPSALLGTVTTKAGGTYLGFTCPWCHAVQGRHFLRIELFRRVLHDFFSVNAVLVASDPGTDVRTRDELVPLDATLTPAQRVTAHAQWQQQLEALARFLATRAGRYPTGRKREALWLRQQRTAAAQGALSPHQRAQLHRRAPKWSTWNQ